MTCFRSKVPRFGTGGNVTSGYRVVNDCISRSKMGSSYKSKKHSRIAWNTIEKVEE